MPEKNIWNTMFKKGTCSVRDRVGDPEVVKLGVTAAGVRGRELPPGLVGKHGMSHVG